MSEQENREKVIKGLERVSNDIVDGYITEPDMACNTINDAIDILKVQEPHVMTLEDLQRTQENEAPVWLESRGTWHGRKGFWIFVYEITPKKKVMRYNAAHMCECGWLGLGAYKKIWRCWTSRPTDEQRKAVAWDA